VPYQRWADKGLLTLTPGNVTDYEFIQRDVDLILTRFAVRDIGFDPWNAMDLVNRLVGAGAPMVEVRQTTGNLTAAMKDIERHYLGGTFDHGADPILTWAASNVVARRDVNDNIAPDRKKSDEKIDPFAALVIADSRRLAADPPAEYDIIIL
jgi:phage terminase large subunit-like protein